MSKYYLERKRCKCRHSDPFAIIINGADLNVYGIGGTSYYMRVMPASPLLCRHHPLVWTLNKSLVDYENPKLPEGEVLGNAQRRHFAIARLG